MSIVVADLSKFYGSQKALNNISFEVNSGEIVGFLGPNGAGKSTTMKIITGYLEPSSGAVTVNGFPVATQSMASKKAIGYLPEHNPLYLDMYIKEFLQFVGKLYDLKGSHLQQRIKEVIQLCGLEKEQHKQIKQLSKGYRQRVGLAQAIIHDPAVLILDEPTTGLDPNQLVEIRELIRSLGKNKTVLFSTHIMQEVEAICDRVIVINNGNLVANETLANIQKDNESLEVIFRRLTKS